MFLLTFACLYYTKQTFSSVNLTTSVANVNPALTSHVNNIKICFLKIERMLIYYLCRRCVGDIFCTVITKSVLRIMDSYILLLCHISFIIGHPSRVRPGKHFYPCAARARHEINLRGASYKLVPECFVNSLLVLMTRPRRACAFAQSHQGPAAH